MIIKAKNTKEYLEQIVDERKDAFVELLDTIRQNLPDGFEEKIQYDMISFVVPKSLYPKGYHCNPEDELAFLSLGMQKGHISLYHMGIYMLPELESWFREEYPKYVKTKLDMGKSCIRFKNMKTIPYKLIGELCQKVTVKQFVEVYEKILNQ